MIAFMRWKCNVSGEITILNGYSYLYFERKGGNVMSQSISQKFTALTLLKFALPTMVMMGFMSLYTIVDGIFVSRFAGSDALSSINIVYPILNLLIAVGVMLATGGSAVVSKQLGEGKPGEARESFSMIAAAGVIVSIALLVVTLLFLEQICIFLGANSALLYNSKTYLWILMLFAPACILQTLYQSFLVTAGKPRLGLILIVCGGISNAAFDYLFIAVLGWGVAGAAIATGIGQMIPAVFGTVYFFWVRKELYYTKFRLHGRTMLQACGNGSSEMVSQLSNAVITVLFNLILMKLAGSDGVAAITIILYGQFLFSSLYLGFTIGVGPVFGFHFGAGHLDEVHRLHKICRKFIFICNVVVTLLSFFGAPLIVSAFVGRESAAYALTLNGFILFSASYLFNGLNLYYSGLFTALSDGKSSAIISFSRTFVFIIISLMVLPVLLGINGVWLAVPLAEFLTVFVALFLAKKTDRPLDGRP